MASLPPPTPTCSIRAAACASRRICTGPTARGAFRWSSTTTAPAGRERQSLPFEHIGALLSQAGYAVLIPERRGYGRSDGLTWTEDVGNNNRRSVARLQEEADDVLAAVDYLRTLPSLDPNRIGIMGWSFGGIVTMFAVSRSTAFAVAVNQAGGALAWNGSAELRTALIAAAEHATRISKR